MGFAKCPELCVAFIAFLPYYLTWSCKCKGRTCLWKLKSHCSDFQAPRKYFAGWLEKISVNLCEMREKYKGAFLSSMRVRAAPWLGVLGVWDRNLLLSSPGSWKLLPSQKNILPVGDLLTQHSKILNQAGVRGDTAIHRGKVLTFVKGSSSLLAATTKFSMKQTLRTPRLPGATSSC